MAAVSGGFFAQVQRVAQDPEQIGEGILWLGWLGYQVISFNKAAEKRRDLESSSEKADALWHAKKEVVLSGIMTTSASTYILTWADEVGIFNLGKFFTPISAIAYLGSAITSTVRLFDSLNALRSSREDMSHFSQDNLNLKRIGMLIDVALSVSFIAWGVFGTLFAFSGAPALFKIVDEALLIGLLLFASRIGYAFFFEPATSKKTTS